MTDAYVSATGGLRAARQGAGLTVESVEAAQDAFRDELDEMEEVQQALANGADATPQGEDEDLNAELEELLRADDNTDSLAELNTEYDLPDISKLNLGSVSVQPSPPSLDVTSTAPPLESRVPILS